MGLIVTMLAGFLVTLAAGMWTGWAMREDHEESRADPPARAGGRGPSPAPAPRPPLPFPGQFLLEIEDPGPDDAAWLAELLDSAAGARARLDDLDRSLHVIRGEATGE